MHKNEKQDTPGVSTQKSPGLKPAPVSPIPKILLSADLFNRIWTTFVQYPVKDVLKILHQVLKLNMSPSPEGYLMSLELYNTLYHHFAATIVYKESAPLLRMMEQRVQEFAAEEKLSEIK